MTNTTEGVIMTGKGAAQESRRVERVEYDKAPHIHQLRIEPLDTPMAAGVTPSVNIGQQNTDTKEATRSSISSAKIQTNVG